MAREEYFNRSLLRALLIVEALGKEKTPLGIGEISRLTGLSKSTTHRLVLTLESRGWLKRLPDNDKYCLGMKFVTLSWIAREEFASCREVHPFLCKLADITKETVLLNVWNNNEVICVDKIEASQQISVTPKLNQSFPIHAGASGFAVLTTMPFQMVAQIFNTRKFETYTARTLIDPQKLLRKYAEAKEKGYVVSFGEKDDGVTGIATGLYFPHEQNYASISVVLPDSRATEDVNEKIISAVLDIKEEINLHFNFATKSI
jgi:DNA-binding IclR family transcriptional regulator